MGFNYLRNIMENENTCKENDLLDIATAVNSTLKSFLLITPHKVQKSNHPVPLVERQEEPTAGEMPLAVPRACNEDGLISIDAKEKIVDTATLTPENQAVPPNHPAQEPLVKPEAYNTETGRQAIVEKRVARMAKAHHTVRKYTLGAMAIGAIPMPLLDLAVLTGLQLDMVHSLSQYYAVPFSKELAKSLLSTLVSDVVLFTTAPPIASLIKIVPIFGQASGALSMITLGGATTYATGKVFIQHFESGGTFLDFDPEKAKAHFQTFYKEGYDKPFNLTEINT
jgi:uncharacterized protein (DUF697 family)